MTDSDELLKFRLAMIKARLPSRAEYWLVMSIYLVVCPAALIYVCVLMYFAGRP